MHARYLEWLDYVFDRPVSEPEWYWDPDLEIFEADEEYMAMLLELTFARSGSDLARFTDEQVNQGLWYLTSPACSDHMFTLKSEVVELDIRLDAIKAIGDLYRDCFAKRCTETLGHLDQAGSALNSICYMFWDISPLGCLEGCRHEARTADVIFGVLREIFETGHLACQEAALHGFGEYSCYYPERVEREIDSLLREGIHHPELREYALKARIGQVP